MKVNVILSIIAVLIAVLLGYWAYSIAADDVNALICGIGSGICFIVTLLPALGIQYSSKQLGVNIKVLSWLFFLTFVVSHFCFASFGVKMPSYIIVNGILLAIFGAAFYNMKGIKDV